MKHRNNGWSLARQDDAATDDDDDDGDGDDVDDHVNLDKAFMRLNKMKILVYLTQEC